MGRRHGNAHADSPPLRVSRVLRLSWSLARPVVGSPRRRPAAVFRETLVPPPAASIGAGPRRAAGPKGQPAFMTVIRTVTPDSALRSVLIELQTKPALNVVARERRLDFSCALTVWLAPPFVFGVSEHTQGGADIIGCAARIRADGSRIVPEPRGRTSRLLGSFGQRYASSPSTTLGSSVGPISRCSRP